MTDNKNIFIEIDATIENALQKRKEQQTVLTEKADKQREVIAQANEDMIAAAEKEDLKAFKNAKKTKEDATDTLELFTRRLEHLENEAFVSEEEGLELVTRIHSIQSDKLDECLARLKPLLDEIDAIGKETFDVIDQGNELINKWSAQVKPFRKVIGHSNGTPIYQNAIPFFMDANEYRQYLNYITQRPQYTAITHKSGYVDKTKRFAI